MKLWLTTMVASPVVLVALILIIDPDMLALFLLVKLAIFIIIFGFIYSIPSFLLVNLLAHLLERNIKNIKSLKVATILVSIIGLLITFLLLYGNGDSYSQRELTWGSMLSLLYGLFIVIFGIGLKIKNETME
jgi:hypothetical protein